MKNIYLVGFMATGKTVVGKELARSLGVEFVDLDSLIEYREKMFIVDIFSQKGEPYFRKIEKEIVKETVSKSDLVVSCGGGVVIDPENLRDLKKSGVVICLLAQPQTILDRSKDTTDRPLLNVVNPKEKIVELFKTREQFYKQSHYMIDTTNLAIREVVDKILDIVKDTI